MMSATATKLLGRGVWRAPYLVNGLPVLIAVDSRGVVRKHAKYASGMGELHATAALIQLLDRIDPVPQLRLVTSAPAPLPSVRPDPRTLEGKRAYWAQLRRAAVAKIPRMADIEPR